MLSAVPPMRCAVLGHPIVHSLSPVMHQAAYAELGLDWTYDAIDLTENALADFLVACSEDGGWAGLSLTMPLKRTVLDFVDEVSDIAVAVGAVNTVTFKDGYLRGDNTDVSGAISALAERGITSVRTMRVLGAGATAASLTYAASSLGLKQMEIVARDAGRAAETVRLGERLGVEVRVHGLEESLTGVVDLLVSTIPTRAIGAQAADRAEFAHAIFDVIYDPWPTPLHTAAAEFKPFVSGLDLLAHQAADQVALMTGRRVAPQLLRDAALSALIRR